MLTHWKQKVRQLKTETLALALAYRDPRVPVPVKIFIGIVVAYAFSPIDLIPDFVPVLGYVDDLVLVPLGIWLALKMIPPEVLIECRERVQAEMKNGRSINQGAAVVIVLLWILSGVLAIAWARRFFS